MELACMISNTPSNRIRWQILLIAIIGSLGFSGYLLFNFIVAGKNEARLEEIRLIKFPVIEHSRRLQSQMNSLGDILSRATDLKDPTLIKQAEALGDEFLEQLKEIELRDPRLTEETDTIRTLFRNYLLAARDRALLQLDATAPNAALTPDQIQALQEALDSALKQLVERSTESYSRSLFFADHSVKQANRWGLVLGFVTIAILIGMAITISVAVVNAINRSDQLKEQFLATISHELRTPMNGIMGAITLLRESSLTEGQKKLLEAASTSSADMLIAVNDILEFSDILSGDFRVRESKWTLKTLLTSITDTYRKECDRRNLLFKADISDDDTTFFGDDNRITHVLRHLLNNAVKFTPVGTISLSVSVDDNNGKRKTLIFEIADTGPGVPEEYIADIFNPFQQLDGSFKRKHGGLGIGLSICKRIADAYGGTLNFHNRDEGGATVTFSLPVKISKEPLQIPAESTMTRELTEPRKERKGELISMTFDTPLTVLVAEDNKVNQMVIKGYLQKLGCDVLTANHGEEAITLLENHDVDVILMDCQMPVMDGFEATQKIRALRTHKASTPIIAVTANAMDADRERCLACGMNAYLKKPVEIAKLRRTIDEQINPTARKIARNGD
jgi:signal transduction histidine kinase/ActR/RegA family two-component response regulator